MTPSSRRTRWCAAAVAASAVLVSCSSATPAALPAATTARAVPATSSSPAVPESPSTSTSTGLTGLTGLTDEELVAVARATLEDNGEPVSSDREPVVKRSDTGAEVAFPTRSDLPPRIGGEPHVFLDPHTGTVLRVTHTR